jgi:nitrate reductase NapAB chaperone NapD
VIVDSNDHTKHLQVTEIYTNPRTGKFFIVFEGDKNG